MGLQGVCVFLVLPMVMAENVHLAHEAGPSARVGGRHHMLRDLERVRCPAVQLLHGGDELRVKGGFQGFLAIFEPGNLV